MATLLKDDGGIPIPQYANAQGDFESSRGADGALYVHDSQLVTILERVSNIMNEVDRHGVPLGNINDNVASTLAELALILSGVSDIKTSVATETTASTIASDVADLLDQVGCGQPTTPGGSVISLYDVLSTISTTLSTIATQQQTANGLLNDIKTLLTPAP